MRGPVKAISSDAVFLIKNVGESVDVSIFWHLLVKSSVENRYLGDIRQNLLTGIYTSDIVRIMQRGKLNAVSQLCHYLRVYQDRLRKFLAAMHHPVTNCRNLRFVFDHPMVRGEKNTNHILDGNDMVDYLP